MNERAPTPTPGLPIEPRTPKYEWGRRVRSVVDLHNDGSYPDMAAEALLVSIGETGEIVQVGMHAESGTPVYLVEFSGRRVVGCLEDEIGVIQAR